MAIDSKYCIRRSNSITLYDRIANLKYLNPQEFLKHGGNRRKMQVTSSISFISLNVLTLYHTVSTFNDPEKKTFKNIAGKGENAGYPHFLLFLLCFYPSLSEFLLLNYTVYLFCSLQMLSV